MTDRAVAYVYDDIRTALHSVSTAVLGAIRHGDPDEATVIEVSHLLDGYSPSMVGLVAASVVANLLKAFDAEDDWPELLAEYTASLTDSDADDA